jgi:hypothetical protein
MATKKSSSTTKTTKTKPATEDTQTARKTERPLAAPASSPAPSALNDVRGDEEPVLGHFVEVTSGKHQGRYGVFTEVADDGKTAVVRTRDSATERLAVPLSNLRPSPAGRR